MHTVISVYAFLPTGVLCFPGLAFAAIESYFICQWRHRAADRRRTPSDSSVCRLPT